jgi:RNA recognition motif-containing protein
MGDAEVTKLYLSNMPPAMTEEQIRDLLSDFGTIDEIEILEAMSAEGLPTSAAYIVLKDKEVANQVRQQFAAYDLMGHRLAVSPASPPKEVTAATDEEREVAERIADTLQETQENARHQILDIVRFCGITFAEKLLEEALIIDSGDGLLIPGTDRRRTVGGTFFKLSKDRMASKVRWFIFRPPERKKEKKEKKEQAPGEQPANKKNKQAKQEKASKKQPPAPAAVAAPAPAQVEPALSPEEAQQKLAELQTALQAAQANLAALKSGPTAKQAGLFSAMKQVVELQKQVDNLLKAHPDLR